MAEIELTPVPEDEAPQEANFATVDAVHADGLSLIFDGDPTPSTKHYPCNTTAFFQAGQRVKIVRDSGTIVVEYPVGAPKQVDTYGLPSGGSTNQVLTKNSGASYDASWKDTQHELPTGGTTGQVLTKDSATDYDAVWDNPTAGTVLNLINAGTTYRISFRTTNVYSNPPVFQIRMGNGQWRTITTT